MNEEDLISLEQVANFLDGTQAIALTVLSDMDDRCKWIQRALIRFDDDALLSGVTKVSSCSIWSRSVAIHSSN